MDSLCCKTCQTQAVEKAYYCYNCGNQLKCKVCEEVLVAGANNCISCGAPVPKEKNLLRKELNSIKYKENKDERAYEIEFTNDVGREIKEVVADLLKNKLGQAPNQPITIRSLQDGRINFSEISQEDPSTDLENQVRESAENLTDAPAKTPAYPHLDDLEIRLDCRENEWLLIFAFYIADFGTSTFTKNEVWDLYKKKRKTETRFKNLGTNWKTLFKKYINTVRENEFRFSPAGLQKVNTLLGIPNQPGHVIKAASEKIAPQDLTSSMDRTPTVSRKVVANSIVQEPFDVEFTGNKEALETFFIRKQPGAGNPNRIVTLAYYITKLCKQDLFTEGNIDYGYRILKLSGKPVHLKQVIINLKNDRVWFQRVKSGDKAGWKLTRQAEIYVEDKLPPRP
jgi:hypothetical protein